MGKIFGAGDRARSRREGSQAATMEWLVDDGIVDGAGLSVARMTVAPGACSQAHSHPNCNEVIHLIAGEVEQTIGTERFVMTPGDTAFIPPGSRHQTRNLGDGPAVMVIAYSAGTRIYEAAEDG